MIILAHITSFESLGTNPGSTRVFPLIQAQPWQRKKRQGSTSFLRKKLRQRRALCGVFFCGHSGKRGLDTRRPHCPPASTAPNLSSLSLSLPTKMRTAFPRMQLAWEELWPWQSVKGANKKFLGCVWCDSCSVRFGSWKKAFTSAFSLPYPILFEQQPQSNEKKAY